MHLFRLARLLFPGLVVGFIAGVLAGGGGPVGGHPPRWALVSALTLGVPLGLLGAGYTMLLINNKVRLGGFAPAALYWLIGFPLARLLHEVFTRLILTGQPGLPPDVLGFLAYQGIVSCGFSIGFLWLHERIAPRWWQRLAVHDPDARAVYLKYAEHARTVVEANERRRAARAEARGRKPRAGTSTR
jgi:hypothetical protein